MKQFKKVITKGFTLTELVITMGLLLIISALVITFIATMANYSKKSNQLEEFNNSQVAFRKEIDYWFSYYDNEKSTIELVNDDLGTLVKAKVNEKEYFIFIKYVYDEEEEKDNLTAIFTYPGDSYKQAQVNVIINNYKKIKIINNKERITNDNSFNIWDFSITQIIENKMYKCVVYY